MRLLEPVHVGRTDCIDRRVVDDGGRVIGGVSFVPFKQGLVLYYLKGELPAVRDAANSIAYSLHRMNVIGSDKIQPANVSPQLRGRFYFTQIYPADS